MSRVRVREQAPPGWLRPCAEALWRAEAEGPASHRVVPDGCLDLIVRYGRAADGVPWGGELLVAGPDRSPRRADFAPGCGYAGIRFRPGEARRILGLEPADLADAGLVPAAVGARLAAVERRLQACSTPEALAARLGEEAAALARETHHLRPPARVRAALAALRRRPPMRVAVVARALEVTPRTLHRELVAWTGLPPAVLIRIFRFRRAWRALGRGARSLADLAAAVGYADQAHMAREFRALAGAPPSEVAMSDRFKAGAAGRAMPGRPDEGRSA